MIKAAILIPAYNPQLELVDIVKQISKNKDNILIVVNDGTKRKEIFEKIKKNCIILEHSRNYGKGVALKTGFRYILDNYENIIGVITADADGQHKVRDIERIKDELIKNPNKFILGSRNFEQRYVPIRSKFGNMCMRYFFKVKTGVILKDTQTGLRGIPISLVRKMVNVEGEKFDYETNVLVKLINSIKYKEVEIETVYEKDKKSSFKPIKDSVLILKEILKK